MSRLRPELRIAVQDLDLDLNLTFHWPGNTDAVCLVQPEAGGAHFRFLDTGAGNADQLADVLRRTDHVVIVGRLESLSVPAPGLHAAALARPVLTELIKAREVVAAPPIRVNLDQVDQDPWNLQNRLAVDGLAPSIHAYRLQQPVVVRECESQLTLVAGHRRFAAIPLLARP